MAASCSKSFEIVLRIAVVLFLLSVRVKSTRTVCDGAHKRLQKLDSFDANYEATAATVTKTSY